MSKNRALPAAAAVVVDIGVTSVTLAMLPSADEKEWSNISIYILQLLKFIVYRTITYCIFTLRLEKHRGTVTERCEVCGRGFEDEEQQRRHMLSHTADEKAGK